MGVGHGDLFGESRNYDVPAPFRDHLKIGTCSWKYDSWKGLVYDTGTKYHAHDYLVDYSRHFNTVEIDQWFWSLFPGELRLPDRDTVTTYAVSVPKDFTFTVKAPNSITLTHFYARQPAQYKAFANRRNEHFLSAELTDRFLHTLEPLRSRLGPVMFQFEYLNTQKMENRGAFFDQLDTFLGKLPRGYEYAVEIRNPDFLCPQFFDLLRGHKAGTVLLDGYHMPPVDRVLGKFDVRTSGFVVIRLHGADRAAIEKATNKVWNRIVEPQPRGLQATALLVRDNTKDLVKTYVNVNNHYEGSAPLTIERLLEELRKDG